MVSDALCEKIADALDIPGDRIQPTTKAEDVPEWDSMGSIRLLLMLSCQFGVTLRGNEVGQLQSVEGIATLVNKKASRT